MIGMNSPGHGTLRLDYLGLDDNGSLAVDGGLARGV